MEVSFQHLCSGGLAVKVWQSRHEEKAGIQVHRCRIFLSWDYWHAGGWWWGIWNCGSEMSIQAPAWFDSRCMQGQWISPQTCWWAGPTSEEPWLLLPGNRSTCYHRSSICDFVTWTWSDLNAVSVCLDSQLWGDMQNKLKDYYYTSLAPEIIRRLALM